MAGKLPNELIREILFPILHVPDEMLHDVANVSPFFHSYRQPPSSVLEVCKSWMTVGTPLLYHIVVLRSKAQASALERTLRMHKELGTFIKKLRIEGGYGASMRTIIHRSPNIRDFCLSLNLRSSDSVQGLVDSLATMNLTCLVIVNTTDAKNAPLRKLVAKICSCISSWPNLNDLYISRIDEFEDYSRGILDSLVNAKNLRTVNIPVYSYEAGQIRILRKNQSLKCVRLLGPRVCSEYVAIAFERLQKSIEVSQMFGGFLEFGAINSPTNSEGVISVCLPSGSNYIPMAYANDGVRDSIWSRVFYFAFDVDMCRDKITIGLKLLKRLNRIRASISAVSKTFNRLALPYTYGFPIFPTIESLGGYIDTINNNPSLGQYVRYFQFSGHVRTLREKACEIFAYSSQLTHISAVGFSTQRWSSDWNLFPFTARSFDNLGKISGHTLQRLLDVAISDSAKLDPSLLGRFHALRSLSGQILVTFDTNTIVSPDWLPNLESIKLSRCSESFLDILLQISLNALQEFETQSRLADIPLFLEKHGSKILRLSVDDIDVLGLCPNLISFTIGTSPSGKIKSLQPQTTQHHLSKIKMQWGYDYISVPLPVRFAEKITPIDSSRFPSLREIQLCFLDWPSNEHEISKSEWPDCSQVLAGKSIKLTDGQGRPWRPRLTR